MMLTLILALSSVSAFAHQNKCIAIESGAAIPFTFIQGSLSKTHLKTELSDFLPVEDSALPVTFKQSFGTNAKIRMSLDPSNGKMTGLLELRYPVTDVLKAKTKKDACIESFFLNSNYKTYLDQDCAECARKGHKQGEFGKSTMTIHLSDGQNFEFALFNFD
jgi:hypothetical protein